MSSELLVETMVEIIMLLPGSTKAWPISSPNLSLHKNGGHLGPLM